MLSHSVVSPPIQSPLSLPLMHAHLRLTDDYSDDLLTMYAQSATTLAEAYLGRALITQTLRMTATATLLPATVPLTTGPIQVFPLWFTAYLASPYRRIELIRSPVQSITTITLAHSTAIIDTLDPLTYVLDQESDPAAILFPGIAILPNDRLCVTYIAGYGVDATTIPQPIIHALLLIVTDFFENRGDTNAGGIPSAAYSLLTPYRLMFFG
jgi:Phage gp6-like head-tail connector protein